MMPIYGTDTPWVWQGQILHTHTKRKKKEKSEASDTIQHSTLSILKYLCIIGPKSDSGDD